MFNFMYMYFIVQISLIGDNLCLMNFFHIEVLKNNDETFLNGSFTIFLLNPVTTL